MGISQESGKRLKNQLNKNYWTDLDKPDLFEKYRSFCIGIASLQFYLTADADVGATLIIGDYIVFRFFPYNSKSCGAIFKKLTFLKNSDQNASKTPPTPLPPPIKGAAREGPNIDTQNGKTGILDTIQQPP